MNRTSKLNTLGNTQNIEMNISNDVRISFYAYVDLINKDLSGSNSGNDFIKRMFLVTNRGILILKTVPLNI